AGQPAWKARDVEVVEIGGHEGGEVDVRVVDVLGGQRGQELLRQRLLAHHHRRWQYLLVDGDERRLRLRENGGGEQEQAEGKSGSSHGSILLITHENC